NLNPARDFAPLCPRPAVLPLPEPWPRPIRFFACFIPLGGRRLLKDITLLRHLDQMSNLVDHPSRGGGVLQLHRVGDEPQAAAPSAPRGLIVLEPDRALHERHLDGRAFCVRSLVSHDPLSLGRSLRAAAMRWSPPGPRSICRAAARCSSDPSTSPGRRTSPAR